MDDVLVTYRSRSLFMWKVQYNRNYPRKKRSFQISGDLPHRLEEDPRASCPDGSRSLQLLADFCLTCHFLSTAHKFWRNAQFVRSGRVEGVDVTAQVVSAVVAA